MIINNTEVTIHIEKKNIKNIYLRLLNAQVLVVTCPLDTQNETIVQFIKAKENWIIDTIKKIENSKRGFKDPIYYLGKKYHLVIKDGNDKVNIGEDIITIYVKNKDFNKASRLFYNHAGKVLDSHLLQFKDKYLNILKDYGYYQEPKIKYNLYKSRWGVCYSRKNIIELNELLIHYNLRCLESVFWHECTHFIVPNHSKRFYYILENHMPDYKKIQKELI